MAVLAILLLVCVSIVAVISSDAVFNEHAVWVSLGDEDYTCADACHILGGSCDATQYTVLTRKLFISKVLPYAVNVKHCDLPGLSSSWKDYSLDVVKLNCELLTADPVSLVTVDDNDPDENTDDIDDDDDDWPVHQEFLIHPSQSCFERGTFDDNDGDYDNGGQRVLCPCIYDSTHAPTETPTKSPTPVPNSVPTTRPTLNHPAMELEKKFAKIEKQLEKEKAKNQN